MTKIEPALYRFRSSEQVIAAMPGYTPPSADWEPLYTEAQMRQLGDAIAAICDPLSICANERNELIKEMMG